MTRTPHAAAPTATTPRVGSPVAAGWRPAINRWLLHGAAKPLAFLLAMAPLVWLAWAVSANALGPNPAEALIRRTGDWSLRLLCVTLAITPLREALGWTALPRLRRMIGLFAFAYACVHFLSYAWLDMGLAVDDIARDVAKRPFILVGMLTLLTLLPLAATSFNRAIRALGPSRWKALHRLVYGTAVLALLHFFWMRAGKNDFAEWSIHAAVIAVLLGWRGWRAWRRRTTAWPLARKHPGAGDLDHGNAGDSPRVRGEASTARRA